jgi:hypothetical protein
MTESQNEIAQEVDALLREKMAQIQGAPGAVIGFEVSNGDFTVNVSIEREEAIILSALSGRRTPV